MIPSASQIFFHLGMLIKTVNQLCTTLDNSFVVQVKPDGVCYRFSRDPNSKIYLFPGAVLAWAAMFTSVKTPFVLTQ
jgi:hypothetical protein